MVTVRGLSPRGRGNLPGRLSCTGRRWSIPAWTGQPGRPDWKGSLGRVYLRVGGATPIRLAPPLSHQGLSPRGRGNRIEAASTRPRTRSIPAWAGQPVPPHHQDHLYRVYPRVGGATADTCRATVMRHGLSPRGRGNHQCKPANGQQHRSIPAWAGQPSPDGSWEYSQRVYPRVGGASVYAHRIPYLTPGLSPRGRGNRGGGRY